MSGAILVIVSVAVLVTALAARTLLRPEPEGDPAVIARVLRHLGLPTDMPAAQPARARPLYLVVLSPVLPSLHQTLYRRRGCVVALVDVEGTGGVDVRRVLSGSETPFKAAWFWRVVSLYVS